MSKYEGLSLLVLNRMSEAILSLRVVEKVLKELESEVINVDPQLQDLRDMIFSAESLVRELKKKL